MKTLEDVSKAILDLDKKYNETKLRKIQWESRKDYHMVSIEIDRMSQLIGQISALKWVIEND